MENLTAAEIWEFKNQAMEMFRRVEDLEERLNQIEKLVARLSREEADTTKALYREGEVGLGNLLKAEITKKKAEETRSSRGSPRKTVIQQGENTALSRALSVSGSAGRSSRIAELQSKSQDLEDILKGIEERRLANEIRKDEQQLAELARPSPRSPVRSPARSPVRSSSPLQRLLTEIEDEKAEDKIQKLQEKERRLEDQVFVDQIKQGNYRAAAKTAQQRADTIKAQRSTAVARDSQVAQTLNRPLQSQRNFGNTLERPLQSQRAAGSLADSMRTISERRNALTGN